MTARAKFAGALVLGLIFTGAARAQPNSCLECHGALEGGLQAPVELFKQDIHGQIGLGCQDCHGGDPAREDAELAMAGTFVGAPKRAGIPVFCARCHSDPAYMKAYDPTLRVDQLELYRTSRHGRLLGQGDTKVAVCTDCHGAHGIQPAKYPKARTFPWNIPETCGRCHADAEYMKPYGIPTDQLEAYRKSVHARALFDRKDMSAPACNSCHGNHGAAPPSITSIAFVCRQCHPSPGQLFSKSPHKSAFDELGFSECEACHGNHEIHAPTDAMLGTGEGAVCVECHEPGSRGYQVAAGMKEVITGFDSEIRAAGALLDEAAGKGVEVSEPVYRLHDVSTLLVSARDLTHGLDPAGVEAKAAEGRAQLVEIRAAGRAALREATWRRTGLAVATLFLILFALAFYLRIRDLRRGPRPPS